MTESGHGAQVVRVLEDHSYLLDEKELESVLLQEEIKNLPVVVVSVAGAYRRGKSFLLNFFLRYLTSPPSARADGTWLGDGSEPLAGFSWRSGSKRNTTGILLWSEPVLMALPTGEKVAVLLMDTQGTFDSESTVRDCSTIFALSTLLSSVQIYNLSNNIQEDDLQHLQLFTEYGRMLRDKEGSKAFQVLEFLVRDWQNPDEFAYGAAGGELFLSGKLQVDAKMPREMKDLRKHITSCFEKVSCFLMPHPGLKVIRKTFSGKITDIDPDFKTYIKELVASIFGPEKLLPKRVNGELVRASDLFTYFKTYMNLFNSDEVPSTQTIMEATVQAGMLSAVNAARAVYEAGMEEECGPQQPSLTGYDLQDLHEKYLAKARAAFTTKKKMGSLKEATSYLEILTKEIQEGLPLYQQSNVAKTQEAISRANATYEKEILKVTGDSLLCLHPSALVQVHQVAYDAALAIFDGARRHISDKKDFDRESFINSFKMRYTKLRKDNEQNHNTITTNIRLQYYNYMQEKCNLEPPLSEGELRREHEAALQRALQEFDSKRNRPSHYTEDVYKYELTQEILKTFVIMKKMNRSKNGLLIQAGVAAYNNYMASAWNPSSTFLHPLELESYNMTGRCRALAKLRPRHPTCRTTADDPDEQTMFEFIEQSYNELKKVNDSANEAAVQEAYRYYYSTMEDLCRPTVHACNKKHYKSDWQKVKFHNETSNKALKRFRDKRSHTNYAADHYENNLKQMMQNAYNEHLAGM